MTTLAFHGDPALKAKYVARAEAHRQADRIVQGWGYWRLGKGCAIGCLAESDTNAHAILERDAGLPVALSRAADAIFELLPGAVAPGWPGRYVGAARPGADLSNVVPRWLLWLLEDEIPRHFDPARFPAVRVVADLVRRRAAGEEISDVAWDAWATAGVAGVTEAAAWAAGDDVAAGNAAEAIARVAGCAGHAAEAACAVRMGDRLIELMAD